MKPAAEVLSRAPHPEQSSRAARPADRPHVLFIGRLYAGHRTRFCNLRAHTEQDPRLRPAYHGVSGWMHGGAIERLTCLPEGARGRMRAALEAAPFASIPRPDAIWTSSAPEVVPYLWAQWGRMHRPLVLDLDWTLEQQESWAQDYYGRPPRRGPRLALARRREQAVWRSVTLFTAWSTWAAESLLRNGVPPGRIRVLPPGVDLEHWRPAPHARRTPDGPLRLLFVGGDFERKGGPLLVSQVGTRFAGRCELDVVTHASVAPAPGVRVHRAAPNSPLLRDLYTRADLFVLPSRAECFGIATVEAMASGVPVIVGDVGGAEDLVDHGRTGWRIEPNADGLAAALEHALAHREALPDLGRCGRVTAERHFDGRRNDEMVVDLLLEEIERHRRR